MKILSAVLIAAFAISTMAGTPVPANAGKADDYYAELVDWAFEPCMAGGAAIDVPSLDQESRELGIEREQESGLGQAQGHVPVRPADVP